MTAISDAFTTEGCTIWEFDSVDVYGNRTYKAPVYFPKSIWYESSRDTFVNSDGREQVAKYEILCAERNSTLMANKNYISLGNDDSSIMNPRDADAHEIESVTKTIAKFTGNENEFTIMV